MQPNNHPNIPELYGLVLAGGQSSRMGEDKGLICYHGKPQREYLVDLVRAFCRHTYISCRPDQMNDLPEAYQGIADAYSEIGSLGAIASAFRQNPEVAWLVVACDLPLLGRDTLRQLVEGRDASSLATVFQSPTNPYPEPLIAIWEPKAYPKILASMKTGHNSPRRILINASVALLDAHQPNALMNVNHPAEKTEVLRRIKKND